ncbi:hypothetical protein RB195_009262 [Necator americanus]|uniref:Peptidase S1 domain-containing protein n=1 Tax=Necator americanus TaxID=51031 RepID=A0ABR1CV37_NECAM
MDRSNRGETQYLEDLERDISNGEAHELSVVKYPASSSPMLYPYGASMKLFRSVLTTTVPRELHDSDKLSTISVHELLLPHKKNFLEYIIIRDLIPLGRHGVCKNAVVHHGSPAGLCGRYEQNDVEADSTHLLTLSFIEITGREGGYTYGIVREPSAVSCLVAWTRQRAAEINRIVYCS